MFFQKVIKGINGINHSDAQKVVDEGIMCNWWRALGTITPAKVKEQLNEANALLHLNHYNEALPSSHIYRSYGSTYGDVSPFISTTAGAIQRDDILKRNILFDPFIPLYDLLRKTTKATDFYFIPIS